MKSRSPEKQQLIDEAKAAGFKVTAKQIDRWRNEKLLPPPGRSSRGRGSGVQRPAREGTAKQLIRLCSYLKEDRSLHRAAFRLWIEAYDVPLTRVRKALFRLAPNPAKLASMPHDEIEKEAEEFTEHLLNRKRVPKRVKEMVKTRKLQPLLNSALALGSGRQPEQDDPEFAAAFEQFAGLERARSDHWEGQEPWLTGDSSPRVREVANLVPQLEPRLALTATDLEFARAKLAFVSLEKLSRCVEFLEEQHGENAFGLSMLVQSPLGVSQAQQAPLSFLGLILFERMNPELTDNVIAMGATLDVTLTRIQEIRRQQAADDK